MKACPFTRLGVGAVGARVGWLDASFVVACWVIGVRTLGIYGCLVRSKALSMQTFQPHHIISLPYTARPSMLPLLVLPAMPTL